MTLENIIKILFENIPQLGIFFLIAGLIKVFTYYKLFGIYIFEFIDIKEVFTLIVNNLLSYFFILLIFSLLFISNNYLSGVFTFLIPILFTILSLLYFFLRKKIFLYEILFQNIIFWVFFIAIRQINSENIGPFTNAGQFQTEILTIFLFTLILYSIINAISEYYKVKYRHYYSKTKLLLDEDEFISTSDKYYIEKNRKICLYT